MAVAPLATREELRVAIREESEPMRLYLDVIAERLQASIRVVAEGLLQVDAKIDRMFAELKAEIARLDRRVTRLEVQRRRR